MQAARVCRVTASPETGTAVFELSTVHGKDGSDSSEGMKRGVQDGTAGEVLEEEKTRIHASKTDPGVQDGKADAEGGISEEKARTTAPGVDAEDKEEEKKARMNMSDGDAETSEEKKARTNRPKDPIRMFGILTPQALRLAQGGSIKMVEELVPKLASVDAEMKEMEIKIRRARKHRAKAEALEKSGETTGMEESRREGVVS